ncbi:MAG: hypothetical protein JWM53_3304 [bacterium]|nr:hypothetical protein [bacterium]
MEKRTLYALLAVVALGAIAFAVLRAPEKGQRKGPPPQPVPAIKASDVSTLELTNDKNEKTELVRASASEWRIKSPGDWKADQQGVKQVLDGLEKLTFADVASQNVDKQAELGVADGKGARVVARTGGGGLLADLHIGKAVGGFTMVRVDGKNDTWQAGGLYPYVVGRGPSAWRDHAIFELTAADVDKLAVEAAGSKLVLQKEAGPDNDKGKDKPNDARWKIVETTGAAPKTAADLDMTQVNAVVSGLSNLHASDFADDKKIDDVKGKGPSVSLTAKDKTHTLWVGGEKGDELYVATSDSPTVYTAKKFSIEHITRKPVDYRDKTIVKAKEADLQSVEITSGGETTALTQKDGKWTAGKGTADDSKVKPAVAGFDNFTASSFSDEKEPAKTGLNKPAGRAVLHQKGKPPVTITVGAATKDGDYYVQRSGSPDVYLVKKYAVDRWMKKTADLIKK